MAEPHAPFAPPKQERSRRTLRKLTEAALALFAEKGLEDTSIADIVKRAGSSVGSFYARFPGKDDFVRYLRHQLREDLERAWSEQFSETEWDSLSLASRIESVVVLLVRIHRESAGLFRTPGEGSDRFDSSLLPFYSRALSDVRPVLLAKGSQIAHPEPERAVDFGFAFCLATIRESEDAARWIEAPLEEESLVRELSRAYLHYLGHGHGPSAEEVEESAEFFDIWG